jgi:hypothetical protein
MYHNSLNVILIIFLLRCISQKVPKSKYTIERSKLAAKEWSRNAARGSVSDLSFSLLFASEPLGREARERREREEQERRAIEERERLAREERERKERLEKEQKEKEQKEKESKRMNSLLSLSLSLSLSIEIILTALWLVMYCSRCGKGDSEDVR